MHGRLRWREYGIGWSAAAAGGLFCMEKYRRIYTIQGRLAGCFGRTEDEEGADGLNYSLIYFYPRTPSARNSNSHINRDACVGKIIYRLNDISNRHSLPYVHDKWPGTGCMYYWAGHTWWVTNMCSYYRLCIKIIIGYDIHWIPRPPNTIASNTLKCRASKFRCGIYCLNDISVWHAIFNNHVKR